MPQSIARPSVPSPTILRPIPSDLSQLSDEQWEAWVRWEAEAYTLAQLRCRQDIIQSQMRFAGTSTPRTGVNNLLIHNDILAAAVFLQAFEEDGWQAFKASFDRLRIAATQR